MRLPVTVRDGDWKLIEYYDFQSVELYNLSSDVSEQRNLAPELPARVAELRAALAEWRQQVRAATNSPNPDFYPTHFSALYTDFDAGLFHPAQATPEAWEKIWDWRKGMDSVRLIK